MSGISPIFAILTPFDKNDRVDLSALKDLLQFLENRRAQSVLTCGTFGEFASLTIDERLQILQGARTHFSGTLINHISSTSYYEIDTLAAASNELADAVLLLPAYYFSDVSDEGVIRFVIRALQNVKRPAYLYNFPAHTQYNFTPQVIGQIRTSCSCLVGIKDSRGIVKEAQRFKQVDPDFEVYVGSDSNILHTLAQGLDGSVTGGGNPLPEYFVQIAESYQAGNFDKAQLIEQELNEWNAFRQSLSGNLISIVKCAMDARVPGFPAAVRAPLCSPDENTVQKIHTFIAQQVKKSQILAAQ